MQDAQFEKAEMERKLNETTRQRDSLLQTIVGGTSRSYVDDATIDQATKRLIEDRKRLDSALDTNRAWLDSMGELVRAMNLNHPGEDKLPAQITNPSTGRWEAHDEDGNLINTGTAWTCNYCSFQDICKESVPTHK